MNKPFIWISGLVLFGSIAVGRCMFAPPPANGEPLPVTINVKPAHLPSTPTPAPTATFAPATGQPTRVQFNRGSYGDVLTAGNSTQYLLWAAEGQTFTMTLTTDSNALASLYTPDGGKLFEQLQGGDLAAVQLPANGDYTLAVMSHGAFTMGVMIK